MHLRKLEMLVTLECHWGCQDCYRAVDKSYPEDSHVTAEQTERLVSYLRENEITIGTVKINGGEPLCNPELQRICEILDAARPTILKIKVFTAYTAKVFRSKCNLPTRVRLRCDPQSEPRYKPNHSPMFISPAEQGVLSPTDVPTYGSWATKKKCKLQLLCGPCFDRWGFTASGSEATLGRILDIPVHNKELKLWGNPAVCRHCILSTTRKHRIELTRKAIDGEICRVGKVYQLDQLWKQDERLAQLPPW